MVRQANSKACELMPFLLTQARLFPFLLNEALQTIGLQIRHGHLDLNYTAPVATVAIHNCLAMIYHMLV